MLWGELVLLLLCEPLCGELLVPVLLGEEVVPVGQFEELMEPGVVALAELEVVPVVEFVLALAPVVAQSLWGSGVAVEPLGVAVDAPGVVVELPFTSGVVLLAPGVVLVVPVVPV